MLPSTAVTHHHQHFDIYIPLDCERNKTLLGLQSRFENNWGQITWNVTALSPKKRDRSSKRVKKQNPAFSMIVLIGKEPNCDFSMNE